MNLEIELYAYKCSVTGNGFNCGYKVGTRYFECEYDANKESGGHINDLIDYVVEASGEVVDMKYIRHAGGPLLAIKDLHVPSSALHTTINELLWHEGLRPAAHEPPTCDSCGSTDVVKRGNGAWHPIFNRWIFDDANTDHGDWCNGCDEAINL